MASQAEAEAAREERAAAIATLRQQERELQALAAARDAAQVTAAAGVGVAGGSEGSEEGAGSAGPSTNGTDLLFLDLYMQRHRRIGAQPISTVSSRHCGTGVRHRGAAPVRGAAVPSA